MTSLILIFIFDRMDSLFDGDQHQGTQDEERCAYCGDLSQNRLIAFALLLSEQLLCAASNGSG